eukprot:TRINITY_DN23871_c0_g1_i2.p1 TRINITY_DN23871_c0_g1~~TRINITY_DN23871_c0_g1_i2.p1  ORF type:complete len:132 (+),score=24.97 TRINITY_DN23871_c0_g1_i2:60-398(+)
MCIRDRYMGIQLDIQIVNCTLLPFDARYFGKAVQPPHALTSSTFLGTSISDSPLITMGLTSLRKCFVFHARKDDEHQYTPLSNLQTCPDCIKDYEKELDLSINLGRSGLLFH